MIEDVITEVKEGRMTAEDAAALLLKKSEYALDYYEPWGDMNTVETCDVLRSIRAAARKIKEAQPKNTTPCATPELVLCGCGHRVPKSQVMHASMGTACPDCYDRMSD